MPGTWSKPESDALVASFHEIVAAGHDFVVLVATPPLELEDAHQALVFLTARLVRFFFIYKVARTILFYISLGASLSGDRS